MTGCRYHVFYVITLDRAQSDHFKRLYFAKTLNTYLLKNVEIFAYLYRRILGAIVADLFSAFATCGGIHQIFLETSLSRKLDRFIFCLLMKKAAGYLK